MNGPGNDNPRNHIGVHKMILLNFIRLNCLISSVIFIKVTANAFNFAVPWMFNVPKFDMPDDVMMEYVLCLSYILSYLTFSLVRFQYQEYFMVISGALITCELIPMAIIHQYYCNFDNSIVQQWNGTQCQFIFCAYSWIAMIIKIVAIHYTLIVWDLFLPM